MEIREGSLPFRHWIADGWCEPLSSERLNAALLHPWEVSYNNDMEKRKRTSRNFHEMIPELQNAFKRMRQQDTVREFAELTNISSLLDDPDAHGAGLHLSTGGSFLQCHCDYQIHPNYKTLERRLNLLLFMHNRWEPDWGGQLLLCDMNGKTIIEIDPMPGRLVVFECGNSSMHGVRVIKHEEAIRLSCAIYYLAEVRCSAHRTRAMYLPNRSNGGVPQEVS